MKYSSSIVTYIHGDAEHSSLSVCDQISLYWGMPVYLEL